MHVNGRRHNYVYYPIRWDDPATGRVYEPGYYDATGTYYEDVAFSDGEKYDNVVCKCPYCDTKTVISLDVKDVDAKVLTCPSCGASMEILSELDDFISAKEEQASYSTDFSGSQSYNARSYDGYTYSGSSSSNKKSKLPMVAVLLIVLGIVMTSWKAFTKPIGNASQKDPTISNIQVVEQQPASAIQVIPGSPVYLETDESGGYHLVNDVVRANKILYWDEAADSWYDESTDCWIWFNTDVEPALWQYWYEGISSNYGDYGWMEHDADGWWVEKSENNWVLVKNEPIEYDDSALWFIRSETS